MLPDGIAKTEEKLIDFSNHYVFLPPHFYQHVNPVPVKAPELIRFNHALSEDLALDGKGLDGSIGAEIFSGNKVPLGAAPIALAYAGHQFGHFVPKLGDGRAVLLGEVVDRQGASRDIQLKGSGQTSFSRRGDGRAALGPVMREYMLSEALHRLGIPTTRSLAFVTTGEQVMREVLLPGAVLTRVAASHLRIGTFEYFAVRQDKEALKTLADYAIARHYPLARQAKNPYCALFDSIGKTQIRLVVDWMMVGFIHGVMNSDNMAISGETIDYGPCAFMDSYDPSTVFSAIDHHGRYAYGRQGYIALWNLVILGECLLSLFDQDEKKARNFIKEKIDDFEEYLGDVWLNGMRRKLGMETIEKDDKILIDGWLDLLQKQRADYTMAFRSLCAMVGADADIKEAMPFFSDIEMLKSWVAGWRKRLGREKRSGEEITAMMRRHNPAFIARNHRVEAAIRAGVDAGDFSLMDQLMDVLSYPYDERKQHCAYMSPPRPEEQVYQTFCGT